MTISTPAPYQPNEVIDASKLVSPPPRLTVLSRSWFRLLFPPTSDPTPEWLRYADVQIQEERGTATWLADRRTPIWRHAELEQYGRMLVDVHNDVCSTRTIEALSAPEAPEVPVEVDAEVTGFRLVLLTPSLEAEAATSTSTDPDSNLDPADLARDPPLWLAPARATLYPPDAYELDVQEATPTWLLDKYRKIVEDIYCSIGFTLSEADAVIRAFAPGSSLLARLTTSFPIPDGYRRLICSRMRNEGPQRDASLLPRLSRPRVGMYQLDFPKSHEVTMLTFDLLNKTGTMSPDNPSDETLEYLENYLLAMRTVFGDDDGEGEYAHLGELPEEDKPATLSGCPTHRDTVLLDKIDEKVALIADQIDLVLSTAETPKPVLVETPDALSPVTSRPEVLPEPEPEEDKPPRDIICETPQTPEPHVSNDTNCAGPTTVLDRLVAEHKEVMATEDSPPPYPVDIDAVYAEFRSRVLDIYRRSPPRQDQLQVLQDRHHSFLRSGIVPNVEGPLSAVEGEELLDTLEARIEGMLPPLLRRWYALMQLNLPIYGQDLPRLSDRIAGLPEDLQREELVGAVFEFDDEEEICPICTEAVKPLDALAITPCYHLMHRDCLEDWFDSGTGDGDVCSTETESCPVCRRDFVLYESLLAITKWPYFEVAWKTWMGQLDVGGETEDGTECGLDGIADSEYDGETDA